MFRRGKVLKVKVELSPEVVGFGRATIVETDGSHLFLQLRTSKGEKRNLPKGTRVWFVSDSIDNPFNGLWSTTIVNTRVIAGKTALECSRPKFEAVVQKRKHRRVGVACPVLVHGEKYENLQIQTRNLSRSGTGIEAAEDCVELFKHGHYIDVIIDTPVGPVPTKARVVQTRYNWLANKTDVGLEFVDMGEDSVATLDKMLLSLGGQPRFAPEGKEKTSRAGQLSSWLKTTKDNVSFVKTNEQQAAVVMSPEDLEELQDDDDIDDGAAEE